MFNKHSGTKDGLTLECRQCNSANGIRYRAANCEKLKLHHKAYSEANREKLAAYHRAWREKNAAKVKAKNADYYRANKEEICKKTSEYKKKWYAKNRDRRKAYEADYCRKNKDRLNAKTNRRRCMKIQALPAWADIIKISALYAESARLSAESGIPHHVDHIVPLISKLVCGLHCEDNLQIIPALENRKKLNRYWPDMP